MGQNVNRLLFCYLLLYRADIGHIPLRENSNLPFGMTYGYIEFALFFKKTSTLILILYFTDLDQFLHWNPGKLMLYNRAEFKTSDHRWVFLIIIISSLSDMFLLEVKL